MPSFPLARRGAKALRALASRAERYPRAPFAVALALAVVAFGAAVDMDRLADSRITEAEELATEGEETSSYYEYQLEEAQPEIVEYGFSTVVVEGEEWVLVGGVLRNPYDRALESVSLSVTAVAEDGNPIRAEDLYVSVIPAGGVVNVGYVMRGNATAIPPEELRLEALEPSYLEVDTSGMTEEEAAHLGWHPEPPEVELLEVVPLASPDGCRLRFRIDTENEMVELSVLFRDAEGRLLGGMPAGSVGSSELSAIPTWRNYPLGESVQELDVLAAWMPEGTDLDAIEIGPSDPAGG
ncbi:hypothetical protein [Glycomyces paridis]|uniref:Uncharacterized protein n=1 Tax=Glycomyces paridis TaxID=2126555 RepID=A0A4S8PSS4_9ACTN|nr:hypothetical protein [Glycomyces paridis]THV31429.1 hypothetical protein E9998_03440 [Glycomyces paridis]